MDFGVSYYPELIPADEWGRDLDLMRESGLTVVRFLEFGWSRFEPREGHYEWRWLDQFLDELERRRMNGILGTPTAAPPPWLSRQFPDMGCVLRTGERLGYGSRRTLCVNHPVYRHFAEQVAGALGERYGRHPAVIGWQIDNELIGPERRDEFICHCDSCQWRFRDWLKQRYQSLDDLNRAWGLGFWSMDFSDWGEIVTPRLGNNQGYVLDAYRFYSDSQVAFIRLQRDALRSVIGPDQFVSHNSTGVFDRGIDHRAYARACDETGWDAYIGAAAAGHPEKAPFAALAHDLFRSSLDRPFWVFETNTNADQYPAYLAEMCARGAKGIVFWHWRQHRASMEQNNPALCDHGGAPNRERLEMIRDVHARLIVQTPLDEPTDPADAAIVFTPDCVRAVHRHKRRPIPYLDGVVTAYRPLWRHGIRTDVVYPDEPLAGYRLLMMPALELMSADQGLSIRKFVADGGVLVVTGPTAHKDLHGVFHPRRGQPLLDGLGFRILMDAPPEDEALVEAVGGRELGNARCVERVEADSAQVIAQYVSGELDGQPAALMQRYGNGSVFYANARSATVLDWVTRKAVGLAGLPWHETPNEDVAVTPDLKGGKLWWFNHGSHGVSIGGSTLGGGDFAVTEASEPALAESLPIDATNRAPGRSEHGA